MRSAMSRRTRRMFFYLGEKNKSAKPTHTVVVAFHRLRVVSSSLRWQKLTSVFVYFHSSHPPPASTIRDPVIVLDDMSIPALTTIFTPSPSCLSDLYFYQPTDFYISLGPPSTSDCLPSGWALSGYFSPGICPSGYAIACSSLNSLGSLTETVATCCPS